MPGWLLHVFQPQNLLVNTIGVFLGILVGAMPGLNATITIALLLPLTFHMDFVSSLILLIGIYCGSMLGGSITAVLFRTPGTPGATATVFEGYPLCQQGKARLAIGAAALASFVGGIISLIFLVTTAPIIARIALSFSAPDFFALCLFGLTLVFSISGKSMVKGCISCVLGMLFGAVGMDPTTPSARLTFGSIDLLVGTPLITAVTGLFAISQIFNLFLTETKGEAVPAQAGPLMPNMAELRQMSKHLLKSSAIGTVIGTLPGTGAQIAALIAYNEARRTSKDRDKFGTGTLDGIAAAEAANNAVTGGALMPMLTLGIPGDAVTAVMMGAIIIQGLQPGPMLFRNFPNEMNTIFASVGISNVLMLVLGLSFATFFAKAAMLPRKYLATIIAAIAFTGAFASRSMIFDVKLAVFFGFVGFFLDRYGFSVAAVALGLILGPMAEKSLRLALTMSRGNLSILVSKPIAAVFLLIVVVTTVWSIFIRIRSVWKEAVNNTKTHVQPS